MSELVLVTGGAGFIGSHMVDRLLREGYGVRVLDNLSPRIHPNGRPDWVPSDVEFIEGDVRDREVLRRSLDRVDVVCHFAAYQDYLNDFSTFLDVNVTSTALLYELIVGGAGGVRKVLIPSTQFVQGEGLYRESDGTITYPDFRSRRQLEAGEWDHIGRDGNPLTWMPTPESCSRPTNAYSMSKHAQETAALVLGRRYGIPTTVLRYSIVQGGRQSFHNAYSGACRIFSLSYLAGIGPVIFEDGRQVRDFVNIEDVIDANMLVMRNGMTDDRVFCVGGGEPISVLAFDRIVARQFGREEIEPRIPGIFRFGDTRHAVSDTSALRELGWSPRRETADSVREYANWLREQNPSSDRLDEVYSDMHQAGVVGYVGKSDA